jgi:crossover junction endodeoxyribonuclease RuvC
VAITAQQFAELQRRVAGGKANADKSGKQKDAAISLPVAGVILGVDPSLRGTGYGVLRLAKPHPVLVACGTLHCPATWTRARCLAHIATSLREVVREHRPDACAIEGLFFAQNLQTALIMGEARGAALAVIAEAFVPIYEISPRKVKQAVVGHGGAQKLAVARMVQRMLSLAEPPAPDAADALALALTFAQETGRHSLTPPKRI